MKLAFETFHDGQVDLRLPSPSNWFRGNRDQSDITLRHSGPVEHLTASDGESRFVTVSWDNATGETLSLLQDLSTDRQVHQLYDISGSVAYVVFDTPEYQLLPGYHDRHSISVTIEYIWDAGNVFGVSPKQQLPQLKNQGRLKPYWAETGGKKSLFYPVRVSPSHLSTGIHPMSDVTIEWSLPVEQSSYNPDKVFIADSQGRKASGGWSFNGKQMRFRTPFGFLPGETYTLNLLSDTDGLTGEGGWWVANDYQFSFTVDSQGEIPQDSLGFVNWTVTNPRFFISDGDVTYLPSGTDPFGFAATQRPPMVDVQIEFDDDVLLESVHGVEVYFRDLYSRAEKPVKVHTRTVNKNRIQFTTTVGNFGWLKVVIKSGSSGVIGKHRGQMGTEKTLEYNISRLSQEFMSLYYPEISMVEVITNNAGNPDANVLWQAGVFVDTQAGRDNADNRRRVVVDLYSLGVFERDWLLGDGSTHPAADRLYNAATLDWNEYLWDAVLNDNSSVLTATPIASNIQLTVDSVSDIGTDGSFEVTFNVPLIKGDVPEFKVHLTPQDPTVPADLNPKAVIREGKLKITVSNFVSGELYDLSIRGGNWLKGERGHYSAESVYLETVEAGSSSPNVAVPGQLTLLSVSLDHQTPVDLFSTLIYTFDDPIEASSVSGNVLCQEVNPNGLRTTLTPTITFSGNQLIIAGLFTKETMRYEVTLKGGPQGLRSSDGLLEETVIKLVFRTERLTVNEPPPANRPGFLKNSEIHAHWNFQTGPTFVGSPAPFSLYGEGEILPEDPYSNHQYVLTTTAPLSGGTLGNFHLKDTWTEALLIKPSAGMDFTVKHEALTLRVRDLTTVHVQLSVRWKEGDHWAEVTDTWNTGIPVSETWQVLYVSLIGALNTLSLRYSTSVRDLTLNALDQYPTHYKQNTQIYGTGVQISEYLVLNNTLPYGEVKNHFGI